MHSAAWLGSRNARCLACSRRCARCIALSAKDCLRTDSCLPNRASTQRTLDHRRRPSIHSFLGPRPCAVLSRSAPGHLFAIQRRRQSRRAEQRRWRGCTRPPARTTGLWNRTAATAAAAAGVASEAGGGAAPRGGQEECQQGAEGEWVRGAKTGWEGAAVRGEPNLPRGSQLN